MVRVDTTGYISSQKDTLGEFQAYDLIHVLGHRQRVGSRAFHYFYLIFPICDKKDFENFLILSMIFALTILSRSILVVLDQTYLSNMLS